MKFKNMDIRTKHRWLRTAWLALTILLVGVMVYVLLPSQSLTFILLVSYIIAVVLFVVYEAVLLNELYLEEKKNAFLIHNAWIQLYIGALSLLTAAISFILAIILELKAEFALLVFIGLTLSLLFGSHSQVEKIIRKNSHLRAD